ncbi:FAD-binding protein [Kozakia baliensis]|uniref:Electron transfer flavoprotein subunit alpha n=1 Tax=Kozakia baliensis TaxID=153496 RepID=A0A1D8UWR2_9PROT|nr:FAD-binding protein [Kozakia baliensis]AOX17927.1 electron transfer flavoprotein subunit beta [Kozakia baliensis]GBR26344.1 electron transfer flavoprotein subunit alpha [Kozakia baliensis NRIC 0488]GEL64382.1 electron transfer flavoprotein subunit alpha [Kozakia baliensis]
MTSLVLIEAEGNTIKPASRSVVAAAKRFGDVDVLLVGENGAEAAAKLEGIVRVLHADSTPLLAETIAALIADRAGDYDHIVSAATAYGKNVLPRLAGLLDVQPITEVVEIMDAETFVRPIYAGNALATVRSTDAKKVLTIRNANFEAVALGDSASAPIEKISAAVEVPDAEYIGIEVSHSDRPELESARVVISGGRGLKDAANFKLLEPIADKLNAAIGASRAAVDAGFAPNEMQVGQTGKIVAPELYIAVGLSGAIQHLAGMKDSKVIVAINMDPEAPIFSVADYGLVGDLFEVLPQFQAALGA